MWINGTRIGAQNSLGTAHVYELGATAPPGEHRLTIRVDNRLHIDVGPNAHSVSDHVQTNWNGIIGRLELQATDPVWMADAQVHPDPANSQCRISLTVGNQTDSATKERVHLRLNDKQVADREVDVPVGGTIVEFQVEVDPALNRWDEFEPNLHHLDVDLAGRGSVRCRFGFREFSTQGTQFAINGRPTFLRGTHDAGVFPMTGYPATDVEAWRRVFQIIRTHGLNHVRYHSWCPPEAAFLAADELGFYLQVECGIWANQGATIGDGGEIDRWLHEETGRILKAYGNHPSFVMLTHGNEPSGDHHAEFLRNWVTYCKSAHGTRQLFTAGANYPCIPENQFQNPSGLQQHGWGQGIESRINRLPPDTEFDYRAWVDDYTVPVISHEIGQWCAYPNVKEIDKYTGFLKARNFEIFKETLERRGMGPLAEAFLQASGRWQTACYRHEIEGQLRTKGLGGFVLLDLHDFPGQGTALVGMLDAFWESKGYMRADEFRRYCSPTVLLARMSQRTWTLRDEFTATIQVANYGRGTVRNAQVAWDIQSLDGHCCDTGVFPRVDMDTGSLTTVGTVHWQLKNAEVPAKYQLVTRMSGTSIENSWEFWVFPAEKDVTPPPGVMVSNRLGDLEWLHLGDGGTLLLLPNPDTVPTPVQMGFSPIYWNTAWTINQAPHTLGLLCDPHHPALRLFPTESHTNWQWWEILHRSAAMLLNNLPDELIPIVQPIDDWHHNRKLGLIFEAQVRNGKVLVCSADLQTDLDERPVARQFLCSLLSYTGSDEFAPSVELTPHAVKKTIDRSR